jgi:hypothetical protein
MALSGSCALVSGFLFGAWPLLLLSVTLVWGITVVADSAQFSTAVSELAPAGTAGSALTLQTASGFLLTAVTILGVSFLGPDDADGWRLAFAALAATASRFGLSPRPARARRGRPPRPPVAPAAP